MIGTLLFLFALVCIGHILIGYPVSLRWRRPGPPIRRDPAFTPAVTAVMAVRNGSHWLEAKLDNLLALDYPPQCFDILVVCNGGELDDSESIARNYAASQPRIRVLRIPAGGKSSALAAAFPHCTHSEALLMVDVRQQLEPTSLRQLAACLADEHVGTVSGELRIRHAGTQAEANVGLYWRFEFWLRTKLSHIDSIFGATGAIYLIRRSLVDSIPANILLDDMFIPLRGFFLGYRLIVEPSAVAWDEPTAGMVEFRRKVRTLAGNYQLLRHYPQLLNPSANRLWFDYLSYKLGRLILPHLLVLLALSSLWLPFPWRLPVVGIQLGGYLLALIDPLVAEGATIKRLTSSAHTFLTMMAAAFCAQIIFFVPAESLWKPTQTQSTKPDSRS